MVRCLAVRQSALGFQAQKKRDCRACARVQSSVALREPSKAPVQAGPLGARLTGWGSTTSCPLPQFRRVLEKKGKKNLKMSENREMSSCTRL